MNRPNIEKPDLNEYGAPKEGKPQGVGERLFMQLIALGGCEDHRPIVAALREQGLDCVLYADVHDPRGVAMLTWSGDPGFFLDRVRPVLLSRPFNMLQLKPEYTMFGRTYALGYEQDVVESLFDKPRRTALNPHWPWAVWYPLRRKGSFAVLPPDQQRTILMEHSKIGMSYVAADYVHDIRLACQGLDTADNDFVLGLVGRELAPLSKIVEAMRKTTQTSQYLEKLGPFFVGRVLYQSRV